MDNRPSFDELMEPNRRQAAVIADLETRIAELATTIREPGRRIASLTSDPSNSSKLPSSDTPYKPSPKSLRKKSGKKRGGQKGHGGKLSDGFKRMT